MAQQQPSRGRRLLTEFCAALVCAASLTACSGSKDLSSNYDNSQSNGFVSGTGLVTLVAPDKRGEPISLTGVTYEQKNIDVSQMRGSVVVLNVWFAECAPCRSEAPHLATVSAAKIPEGVKFVGINTSDDIGSAQAFEKNFNITYQSIDDRSGKAIFQLRGKITPNAVPTTIILDKQGRIAARVSGEADETTLTQMIADLEKESA